MILRDDCLLVANIGDATQCEIYSSQGDDNNG